MFIAHLPAGYIVACATQVIGKPFFKAQNTASWKLLLITSMVFSVLPDFDLLWFYLVDHRQVLHHRYYTHLPLFWLVLLLPPLLLTVALRRWKMSQYIAVALVSVLMHQFLDTVSGGIKWLWPFANEWTRWFTVPAIYNEWIVNFIFHWTFLLELGVFVLAAVIWSERRLR